MYVSNLQTDLDNTAETWNSHKIRQVHNSRSPSGRPLVLYTLPELGGTRSYMCDVSHDVHDCLDSCLFRQPIPCNEHMFELWLCTIVMAELNLALPNNSEEACELYLTLRHHCHIASLSGFVNVASL